MKQFVLLFTLLFNSLFVVCEFPASGSPPYINDNNALQYALTLEHLEAAFYNQALTNLTTAQLNAAGISGSILTFIQLVRDHENMHVAALTSTLTARGATPVSACQYNFGINNATSFLAIAQALENTGVMAYDFAVVAITDPNLLTFATTVATVEARHAAFLNSLNGNSPFPNATDTAKPPSDILAIANQFIVSCPTNITLPVSADSLRNLNGSGINQTAFNPYMSDSVPYMNDNIALNYALTLEYLEASFYNQGLQRFNGDNFTTGSNLTAAQFDSLLMIQAHENAHVAALQMVLSSRGADAVKVCNYSFTYSNTKEFLTIAQTLENTGVSAYDGAASTISDESLLMYAATIATVEARHASFLNEILGGSPFPNSQDIPLSPSTVGSAIQSFIVNCPQAIVYPVPSDSLRNPNASIPEVTSGAVTSGAITSGTGSTTNSMTTATVNTAGDATTSVRMTTSPMMMTTSNNDSDDDDEQSSNAITITKSIFFISNAILMMAFLFL